MLGRESCKGRKEGARKEHGPSVPKVFHQLRPPNAGEWEERGDREGVGNQNFRVCKGECAKPTVGLSRDFARSERGPKTALGRVDGVPAAVGVGYQCL